MRILTTIFSVILLDILSSCSVDAKIFIAGGTARTAYDPISIASADLDSDGYIDIIVGSAQSFVLILLYGRGDGNFDGPFNLSIGSTASDIVVVDINGDGVEDIVTTGESYWRTVYVQNNGNRTYQAPVIMYERCPTALSAADIDNDGDMDIISTDHCDGRVKIRHNQNGTLDTGMTSLLSLPISDYYCVDLFVEDVENNGTKDIVVAGDGYGSVSLLRNQGGMIFLPSINIFPFEPCVKLTNADYDGDGYVDFAGGFTTSEMMHVFLNDGTGRFLLRGYYQVFGNLNDLVSGDFDGINGPDLAVLYEFAGEARLSIYLNNGDGTFDFPIFTSEQYSLFWQSRALEATDFDCDGDLDLFYANETEDKVSWLINTTSKEETNILPVRIYAAMARPINPISAFVILSNFTNGHRAVDVDTSSILINGEIIPFLFTYHYPNGNPCGQFLRAQFPLSEFVGHYGQFSDSSTQNYTVTGQYTDGTMFEITGEITLIGHRSGDFNGDGLVGIGDLVIQLDYLYRNGSLPEGVDIGEFLQPLEDPKPLIDHIFYNKKRALSGTDGPNGPE